MRTLTTRSPRDGQRHGDWFDQWANALASHEEFIASNMTGSTVFDATLGRLPEEWATTFRVTADHREAFIIRSYATPIAWHSADGTWWLPAVAYGSMTRQHRARILETLVYSDRDGITRLRTTPLAV